MLARDFSAIGSGPLLDSGIGYAELYICGSGYLIAAARGILTQYMSVGPWRSCPRKAPVCFQNPVMALAMQSINAWMRSDTRAMHA
eukprot:359079-Chlamydomonas_euryale.AAC.5